MKIEKIDRATCQQISDIAQKALQQAFFGTGIDISVGRGTFSSDRVEFKIGFVRVSDGKNAKQIEFEKYAPLFGFKPEDFNAVFMSNGRQFILQGFKINSPKYPIIAIDAVTKKPFKMSVQAVQTYLQRLDNIS